MKPLNYLPLAVALGCVLSPAAHAQEVGRVISSTPIIQQVAVPRQVCTQQQVATQAQKSGAGSAMGAIAGGVIGATGGSSVGGGGRTSNVLGVLGAVGGGEARRLRGLYFARCWRVAQAQPASQPGCLRRRSARTISATAASATMARATIR